MLLRKPYWSTLRITAWALRFAHNCLAKTQKKTQKKQADSLCTEEILQAREHWIRRVQKSAPEDLERPGWKVTKDKNRGILKCVGRILGYSPTFLEDGPFIYAETDPTHP